MNTTVVSTRRARGNDAKGSTIQQQPRGKGRAFPEYLEAHQVRALTRAGPRAGVMSLILTQWLAIRCLSPYFPAVGTTLELHAQYIQGLRDSVRP